jgi:predicted amidohydrolase
VSKTPLGNIGTIICNDGYHPEYFRAVQVNGAEIIIRRRWPSPASPKAGSSSPIARARSPH